MNEADISTLPAHSPRNHNLTKSEKMAIKKLFNNPHIIIKPADKGSAVVIQNTTDYISEIDRQLSNTKFYKQLDHNSTQQHNVEVTNLLTEMLSVDEIDETCCIPMQPQPRFYTRPKFHKATRPPPGRPILSANQCLTKCISEFVDFFLKPTIPHLKSYIKNTTHFLQIIQNIKGLPRTAMLVTLDVTSLYTNIPNKEGIRAAAKTLARHRPGAKHPTNQSLIRLLTIVNNGQHCLQISGTAMGTLVAPSPANNFMGHFEETHVHTHHTQPYLWLRFIDDIFMIWTNSLDSYHEFISHLNSCHQSIKFTAEMLTQKVNFLDTTVYLTHSGSLSTTLYSNPTDSHNYLLHSSSHSQHYKIASDARTPQPREIFLTP